MKHLFASGEHIYSKNVKTLEQGNLVAEYLVYDEIGEDVVYEVIGSMDEGPVSVKFRINRDSFQDIKFKHLVRILMQSDILQSQWEYYEIEALKDVVPKE